MVVQWVKLPAPNSGGPSLIPGQGTRSHVPQLKILHAAMKIKDPRAATKIWHSQIKKEKKKIFQRNKVILFLTVWRFVPIEVTFKAVSWVQPATGLPSSEK